VRESRNKIFLQKKIQLCWAFIFKSGVGRTLEHQINDVKKIMGEAMQKVRTQTAGLPGSNFSAKRLDRA
jgi:hypothetical protein